MFVSKFIIQYSYSINFYKLGECKTNTQELGTPSRRGALNDVRVTAP
jgi:hypothetical protein